jgi:PAS domain S-box-containing protein
MPYLLINGHKTYNKKNFMKNLAKTLQISNMHSLEYILESIRTPVTITDHLQADEPIIFCNKAFLDLTGYDRDEVIGKNCRFLQGPETDKSEIQKIKDALSKDSHIRVTFKNYFKGGKEFINDLMVTPIKNSDGKVTHFLGMQMNVTQIVKQAYYEQQLRHMSEEQKKLQALAKAKDEFISIASHQLRTPSSAVKQYLGLLLEGHVGTIDPETLSILRKAYNSNERQINIISELLETAKKDADDYELHKAEENISTIISEVLDELHYITEIKNQTLDFQPVDSLFAFVDRKEFKTALLCVIENASKYSYSDSAITINASKTKENITITIMDHGVGIGEKDLAKIFDKFTRVNNDLSDTVSGNGLGLYWAKRVMGLHGGSVKVASVLGKGSTFTIELPIK